MCIRAMTCICSPIIRIELVGEPALYERFASYVIFGAFSAISQGHRGWFPGGQGRRADERTNVAALPCRTIGAYDVGRHVRKRVGRVLCWGVRMGCNLLDALASS